MGIDVLGVDVMGVNVLAVEVMTLIHLKSLCHASLRI